MDPTIAGLIGALIGSLAGILGAVINSHSQARLEREKWERSLKSQQRQELLEAITEFSKIASSMFSLISNVTVSSLGFNTADDLFKAFKSFEKEAQNLLVQLYASHTLIALLDKDVYYAFLPVMGHLVPLYLEVLDIINNIRAEILDIKSNDDNAVIDVASISKGKLSNKYLEALNTYDSLIRRLSEDINFPELVNLSKLPSQPRKG